MKIEDRPILSVSATEL